VKNTDLSSAGADRFRAMTIDKKKKKINVVAKLKKQRDLSLFM
jgi:hypothetical protein